MGGEEGGREGGAGPPDPNWKEGNWNDFKLEGSAMPSRMMEIFLEAFPDYPVQEHKDHTACWEIAYQLAGHKGWKWQSVLNGGMEPMLEEWREIVAWARGDPWYKTQALSFWNDHYQGIIQKKINGTSQEFERGKPKVGTSIARTEALRNWGDT